MTCLDINLRRLATSLYVYFRFFEPDICRDWEALASYISKAIDSSGKNMFKINMNKNEYLLVTKQTDGGYNIQILKKQPPVSRIAIENEISEKRIKELNKLVTKQTDEIKRITAEIPAVA